MAIKDILVHVDHRAPAAARVDSAVRLAETFGARLTGVYVLQKPFIPAYAEIQISSDILEAQAEEMKERAAEREKAFMAAAEASGVLAEWRLLEGNTVNRLSVQARYFDLAVVGQANPDDHMIIGDREMPDRLILSAGVPVLVVPYIGKYPAIGRNVMVAWDGSPVAARAAHDAMPFLEAADKVTVMVVNPNEQSAGLGDLPGADIAAHLARHGVNAEADHVQSDLDPGNMLLSRAADLGIDLLVMGAYGHARWAELVLGGVTDHMMNHMTVPVLMSH